MNTTQHGAFDGDPFAAHMGSKVMDAGALPIAYDVKLLRELLKRREAELHATVYNALIWGDCPEAENLAKRMGVHLGGDGDPLNDKIVYPIMEAIIRGEDPRVAIEKRFVEDKGE